MSLEDKLKKIKAKKNNEETANWLDSKNLFKEEVEALFGTIKTQFNGLVENELLEIEEQEIEIEEDISTWDGDETSDKYSIVKLILDFDEERIVAEPIGASILGACGRIDFYVEGSMSETKKLSILLVSDYDLNHRWIIWAPLMRKHQINFSLVELEDFIESCLP